jgi:uridine kinase
LATESEESASQIVHWDAAPALILRLASEVEAARSVVGITGPVGAGKSTLARMLSACILATDDFLPDHDATERELADEPGAADLTGVRDALIRLRAGEAIEAPVWSFHTHSRVGARTLQSATVIVCEGIHAHEPDLADLIDVRVYVEAAAETRLARWEAMALTGARGWNVEQTRAFFREVAEPTFHARAERLRAASHVVVRNP